MHVRATHTGFYVKLRKPGDEFDVPDALFSRKWMERVVVEPSLPTEQIAQAVEPVVKKRRGRKPKQPVSE